MNTLGRVAAAAILFLAFDSRAQPVECGQDQWVRDNPLLALAFEASPRQACAALRRLEAGAPPAQTRTGGTTRGLGGPGGGVAGLGAPDHTRPIPLPPALRAGFTARDLEDLERNPALRAMADRLANAEAMSDLLRQLREIAAGTRRPG